MLEIGSFKANTCSGFTRRTFLRAAASVPLGLGLSPVAAWGATGNVKSIILVWLWGAPSHIDTFDPKPNAPADYRGPFANIPTRTPGVHFTEILPKLAARSHQFSLIRSHVTHHSGHLEAGTWGLTGFAQESGPQPSFGAIAAKHRGSPSLPGFLSLTPGPVRDVVSTLKGYGGGVWGAGGDPLMIDCTDTGRVDIPTLRLLEGLGPERLNDRRLLLGQLDRLRRGVESRPLDGWDRTFETAYSLLTSRSAQQALDLSQETAATREAYGHTRFGQSMLLSRRLAEAGVPFVQCNWSQYVEAATPNCDFGWDTHIYNFELLSDHHGPIFDRAMSALLDDLRQRGLLDQTLVVAMGEFGRTPKINTRAARDHWPRCYFSLWAGGGVRPGRVIGASDKVAEDPVTEPISPIAVGTTMLETLGVNTVARAEMRVLDGGRVIHDLF